MNAQEPATWMPSPMSEQTKLRIEVAGLLGTISAIQIIRDAGYTPEPETMDKLIAKANELRFMMGLDT